MRNRIYRERAIFMTRPSTPIWYTLYCTFFKWVTRCKYITDTCARKIRKNIAVLPYYLVFRKWTLFFQISNIEKIWIIFCTWWLKINCFSAVSIPIIINSWNIRMRKSRNKLKRKQTKYKKKKKSITFPFVFQYKFCFEHGMGIWIKILRDVRLGLFFWLFEILLFEA